MLSVGVDSVAQPRGQKESVGDPNSFLVVDCLLPGQVRKLGATATFLSPRRPLKTSARECEIRGGEYVAYDRANYATALKVWLPTAEQGDPSAETYVGEIFQRGLGTPPDYQAALTWYRRAAEHGSTRAAHNLAVMFDQGTGGVADPAQAAFWYSRAASSSAISLKPPLASRSQPARSIGYPPLPTKLAPGRSHALVIANTTYRAFPRVAYAESLARTIAQTLTREYKTQVTLLTDASRADILTALEGMRARLTEADKFLLLYAGHWRLDQRDRRSYWLPVDAAVGAPSTWIPTAAITNILDTIAARQILVVAGSSYDGVVADDRLPVLTQDLDPRQLQELVPAVTRVRSRLALALARADPDAEERAEVVLPSFAAHFVKLLQSNVGVLPGQELYRLMLRALGPDEISTFPALTYGPIQFAGHEFGDFLFVRGE